METQTISTPFCGFLEHLTAGGQADYMSSSFLMKAIAGSDFEQIQPSPVALVVCESCGDNP